MLEKKEIITALNKAREKELEKGVLQYQDSFFVAPQVEQGKSLWASLLKDKYIKPWQVLWAIQKEDDKKSWLAVRVELPTGVFYFNLRHSDDRKQFEELTKSSDEKFRSYLPDMEEPTPF